MVKSKTEDPISTSKTECASKLKPWCRRNLGSLASMVSAHTPSETLYTSLYRSRIHSTWFRPLIRRFSIRRLTWFRNSVKMSHSDKSRQINRLDVFNRGSIWMAAQSSPHFLSIGRMRMLIFPMSRLMMYCLDQLRSILAIRMSLEIFDWQSTIFKSNYNRKQMYQMSAPLSTRKWISKILSRQSLIWERSWKTSICPESFGKNGNSLFSIKNKRQKLIITTVLIKSRML